MTGQGARTPCHLRNTGVRVPCGRFTHVLVAGCHDDSRCPQRVGGLHITPGFFPPGPAGIVGATRFSFNQRSWVLDLLTTGPDPHVASPTRRPPPALAPRSSALSLLRSPRSPSCPRGTTAWLCSGPFLLCGTPASEAQGSRWSPTVFLGDLCVSPIPFTDSTDCHPVRPHGEGAVQVILAFLDQRFPKLPCSNLVILFKDDREPQRAVV